MKLGEALAIRSDLHKRIAQLTGQLQTSVLRAAAEAVTQAQARYSRSEIRMARQLDVTSVRKQIDDLARERRELDTTIQEHNWTIELIHDTSR